MEGGKEAQAWWRVYIFKERSVRAARSMMALAGDTPERWTALNPREVDFLFLGSRSQGAQPGVYSDFSVGNRWEGRGRKRECTWKVTAVVFAGRDVGIGRDRSFRNTHGARERQESKRR